MSQVQTKVKTKVSNVVETSPIISDEIKAQIISEHEKNRVITEKESALIIASYKEKQKKQSDLSKAQRSELTINRLDLNTKVKKELLTFDNVYQVYIRQSYSFLTSRPTIEKINANLDIVVNELMTQCSDTQAKKVLEEKMTFDFSRLPRLLTDKKLIASFMTDKQFSTIKDKSFSGTNIVDLLIKGLTCKVQVYESGLKKSKTIVLPSSDLKLVNNAKK
jgi:hypothetical protein